MIIENKIFSNLALSPLSPLSPLSLLRSSLTPRERAVAGGVEFAFGVAREAERL